MLEIWDWCPDQDLWSWAQFSCTYVILL
jgi:hypothetical protein